MSNVQHGANGQGSKVLYANTIQFSGNVCKLVIHPQGSVTLSLANTNRVKDPSGQYSDGETTFKPVSFSKDARAQLPSNLQKGDRLAVEGKLISEVFQGQNGEVKFEKILAFSVLAHKPKGSSNHNRQSPGGYQHSQPQGGFQGNQQQGGYQSTQPQGGFQGNQQQGGYQPTQPQGGFQGNQQQGGYQPTQPQSGFQGNER